MSIIVKYKFDKSIYADLLPEFNAEFTSDKYNTTDEEVDGIITRTIESDELPTLMRFGRLWVSGESASDNRTDSLLEVLEMNTSGLTSCHSMFRCCKNLTSINCEWDTNNVTDMYHMFYDCTNLSTLDVSNFNISKVTSMGGMFYFCTKLTSLDVSNFNTSNVTDMNNMFYGCHKLTSLDVSNFDTSKISNLSDLFNSCYELTEIKGIDKWNINSTTNILGMFCDCYKLTSLNLSNWNTSNIVDIRWLFCQCRELSYLDISNWNLNKVTNGGIGNSFTNVNSLLDIGMLYCDQPTINKVASLLPTDITQAIWVEDVDIKDLTPVEGVEFKQYAKNTEIILTSPLLEGDKLIVKDGKLYHWHKMGMIVLDGSEDENWTINSAYINDTFITYAWDNFGDGLKTEGVNNGVSDRFFSKVQWTDLVEGIWCGTNMNITINKSKLSTQDVNGFKKWLQANPTTVVYKLASPYYELISEDPLTISLIAESSDITNSSNIPLNMTINNKGLSTVAISPSTTYTIAFDKDEDSEVVVNLCGNEVTTTDNIVEITTPSEIDDELIFYGDGVEISNVRLLEGSVSGDSVPRESFEGLKNSFEDGYIPENALDTSNILLLDTDNLKSTFENNTLEYKSLGSYTDIMHPSNIMTFPGLIGGKTYTMVFNSNANCNVTLFYNWNNDNSLAHNEEGTSSPVNKGFNVSRFTLWEGYKSCGLRILTNPDNCRDFVFSNFNILEGDWTHLTEEDFNNLGKYKVEYKVTGRNKFDINLWNDAVFSDGTPLNITNNTITINAENDDIYSITGANGYEIVPTSHRKHLIKVKPNTTYTLSMQCSNNTVIRRNYIFEYDKNYSQQAVYPYGMDNVVLLTSDTMTFTTKKDTVYIGFRIGVWKAGSLTYSNIQLEEGSTPTEYELYKSYTKTFYLNSPLLEGDTIEDIDGVATHVRRYEKIVLDGSDDEELFLVNADQNIYIFGSNIDRESYLGANVISNNFSKDDYIYNNRKKGIMIGSNGWIRICLGEVTTLDEFKQWLSENPTTIIYELASPILEPISTEPILCDSYVNGHLDVDTNVPIEKVEFKYWCHIPKYIQPSTKYKIQFEADNTGWIDKIALASVNYKLNIPVTKGVNVVEITTDELAGSSLGRAYLDIMGIGFNASNIQVVATDRNTDFGYFKGLQSSFESELVTDEADENYGKYKVECKVVGKNKFDGELRNWSIDPDTGIIFLGGNNYSNTNAIKIKGGQYYKFTYEGIMSQDNISKADLWCCYYDHSMNFISLHPSHIITPQNAKYLYFYFVNPIIKNDWYIQVEEGTQATPYEPYQEYTKTIYLNSPLLKGDTIEVHNGKLCHYHKMGMVVLDGSEDEKWFAYQQASAAISYGAIKLYDMKLSMQSVVICDNYVSTNDGTKYDTTYIKEQCYPYCYPDDINFNRIYFHVLNSKLPSCTIEGFKQWFANNPTTVVYELAEPYYEEISPIQEDLIITSVKEGDLHIDTIVPISSKVTYNVNVQLLTDFEQSIVEQVQATQTTDLQSILDEEIDN